MNDKYVQIFTGDFNDFEKHKGKFKDCQIRSNFTDEFTDFNSKTLSNFHWCLSYFSRNQFESQE